MTKPKCKLQPCGHPVCAIRCENENAEQTTNWCGWCEDIEKARQDAERQATVDILKVLLRVDGAIP